MTNDEQLHDFQDEVRRDKKVDDGAEPEVVWSGVRSKIALAPGALVLRDFEYIDSKSECIDCRKAGKPGRQDHQFHVKAEKRNGRWFGPEGGHVEDLRRQGFLRGTREAEARIQAQVDVDYVRGTEPSNRCRACGSVIERDADGNLAGLCPNNHRNGLPELRPRTLSEMKKLWANVLPFEKAQEIERGQVRDETRLLRQAIQEGLLPIGELIKEALSEVASGKAKK